ncbi:MAG TPA: MGMT family protein [Acidobacteriota bacterium]|jgi:methylated-DNA-protein-cysteine methyltransferase-like protein|nr:MGMT family protein [Acidobacteriota bacterium]
MNKHRTRNTFDRIHSVIRRIPAGKIATYGEVALKSRVSVRTIVWALHKCPKDVPWHRVVGKGGEILLARRSPLLGAEQAQRLSKEGWKVEQWRVTRRESGGRKQEAGGRNCE